MVNVWGGECLGGERLTITHKIYRTINYDTAEDENYTFRVDCLNLSENDTFPQRYSDSGG